MPNIRHRQRLERLERKREADGASHMEIVEYDGYDSAGKPARIVEIRFGAKPIAVVTKELWDSI